MTNHIINIGILAHVDAGKTSLSERLLYKHNAVSQLGSIDAGNTQTDNLELERERGITIRSAVVSFTINDLQVNLVDTPGHPDFIAEVDRALAILDGAILVVSAVEGVQAQTIVLLKSLKANNIPTLIFVNKIDRVGARSAEVIKEIAQKLNIQVIPITTAMNEGNPLASVKKESLDDPTFSTKLGEVIAETDLEILEQIVNDKQLTPFQLKRAFLTAVKTNTIYPIFVGSAVANIGIKHLSDGISQLLPSYILAPSSKEVDGHVFAISRQIDGSKQAYVRLIDGELRVRDQIKWSQLDKNGQQQRFSSKITRLEVIGQQLLKSGSAHPKSSVLTAGAIGCLYGLKEIKVGARLGNSNIETQPQNFLPPTLEAIVTPLVKGQERVVYKALLSLADEDPLIQVELKPDGKASVLLFGEVQKEVIAERIWREFGIKTKFTKSSHLFFERPIGKGAAEHIIDQLKDNDFWATVGLVVKANPMGTGNTYSREVLWGQMVPSFYRTIETSIFLALKQGLYGWPVTDCHVSLVKLDYIKPVTVAADFKNLVPYLLLQALNKAKTQLLEPCMAFDLEMPEKSVGGILSALSVNEAEIAVTKQINNGNWQISGEIPARCIQNLAALLPGLSHGEALFTTHAGKARHYNKSIQKRERTDGNSLNLQKYLTKLSK